MRIHISPHDGIPVYLQIINQVKYLIASRRLAPMERLPSVRRLAEQLVINPNTVARAYRELENQGVLATRRGAGVFVSEAGSPLAKREKERILSERIDGLLAEAEQLSVSDKQLMDLIESRRRLMNRATSKGKGDSHE